MLINDVAAFGCAQVVEKYPYIQINTRICRRSSLHVTSNVFCAAVSPKFLFLCCSFYLCFCGLLEIPASFLAMRRGSENGL